MKRNWKRLIAILLAAMLLVSALPVSLGEDSPAENTATATDLPEEGEASPAIPETGDGTPAAPEAGDETPDAPETGDETPAAPEAGDGTPAVPEGGEEQSPEEEAAEADAPAVLSLELSRSALLGGEELTVTAQVAHAEKALLLLDGQPWPAVNTEGMTDEEAQEALLAAAATVPEDGQLKLSLTAPQAAGSYAVSLRLWADGAWIASPVSRTLKVLDATSPNGTCVMSNDEIIGTTVYLGVNEVGSYVGTASIKKIRISNSKIVSVAFTGASTFTVTPKKTGSVKLTIYWSVGGSKAYTFIVLPSMETAAGITMSAKSVSVPLGETVQLSYTLVPSTATTGVTFRTSSKKIATVSAGGVVTGLKEGTATVTATTWTGKKATVKVTVYDPKKPTSVSFSEGKTATLLLGSTLTLTPVLKPATAESAFTWTTSNKKVATVDANGTVTPVKEGTAVITVKTWNKKTAKITLKVVDPYKPSSLSILVNESPAQSGTTQWASNQELKLTYTAVAYGGEAYTVPESYMSWSSSSSRIASIDQDGNVTIKKAGTVTFTLKGVGGAKATVKFKFVKVDNLTKITVSPTTASLNVGGTKKFSAVLTPTTAAPLVDLVWSSSNTEVATVTAAGLVTAVGYGTAVIYAKDANTGIYGAASVVVSCPSTYRAVVAVEPTYLTISGHTVKSTRQADLDMIVKTLGQQSYSGRKWSVTKLHGTSKSTVLSALNTVAGQANEHDVTLFFFMGHGSSDGSIHFFNGDYIKPSVLKTYLDKIPGKVIVMLGSCYSGEYVAKGSAAAFNSAILSTFGQGETVPETFLDGNGHVTELTADMLTDSGSDDGTSYTPKRGELRASKYYVLTSAAAGQEGWSTFSYSWENGLPVINESGSYTFFVRGVCRAGGWDGITKQTLWTSGTRTLSQVYSTAYSYCASQGSSSSNVQVYPSGSDFVIFSK